MNNESKILFRYFTSSHGLILLTYTTGFAVLALVTSLLVSYMSTREAEKVFVNEGTGFAELAAQSAVIPLLTGSRENGEDYLNPLIAYQNVYHITVYGRDFRGFFMAGNESSWQPSQEQLMKINHASLIHEDNSYWYIAAPVLTEGQDSERIGNVFIVITKTAINKLGNNIHTYTLWICTIAASILWVMLYLVLRRITLPIQRMAGFMDISKGISQRYRTPSHVPSDVKTIYSAFNSMLDQIDIRNKQLKDHISNMEDIVKEKTSDLIVKNEQLENAHNNAVAASHAKDIFVANVSHELRTPIQAIMGNCELLSDKYQDHELAKIIISANQLLNLINNILDLSKIENDKLEVKPTTISVRNIMTQIAEAIAPVIKLNNNTFDIEINHDVNEVTTDRELITQIINNLLSNAGRYTHDGHVTFRVRKKRKNDIDCVCFEVIDTGIGIAEDKLEKIFQPFEQADMSKTRLYGGTGLGLTISKKLAALLGGELTVESKPGQGSTFNLCIPEGKSIKNTQHENRTVIKCSPQKILLAEDHPFISDAVKQLLENDGHSVSVVSDGVQAIKTLGREHFDIALIDVHMPELDGIEVIRNVQASNPDCSTRIFLLTADVTKALRQQAEALGVKIIQKPFNRTQLAEHISAD